MQSSFLPGISATMVALGAALSVSALLPNAVQAFTMTISPQYGSTNKNAAGVIGTGATTLLDFDFEQAGSNVWLNLNMTNTTNGTAGMGATGSTLVGTAFDLISGVKVSQYTAGGGFTKLWTSAAGDNFDTASLSGNAQLSNGTTKGFGTFAVGASPDRNNFNGGNPTSGLTAGNSTLVKFLLTSTTVGTTLDAATVENLFRTGFTNGTLNAAGRFQQVIGAGSFTSDKVFAGGVANDPGSSNVAAVPEPTTLLGTFAAGSLLLGRKKLQRKAD